MARFRLGRSAFHVTVAHGHPEQAFGNTRCLLGKRGLAGKSAAEQWQSDHTAAVSKQCSAGDLVGGDIGHVTGCM